MMKKTIWAIKNIINGPKNLIFRSLGQPLNPRWLVLMATDRCNSRCTHCSIWQQKPVDDPLSPAEIEKTLKDKLFQKIEYVLITGGEPVIRNDLQEIVSGIHRVLPKAVIQLSTNGLLPERFLKVVKNVLEENIVLDIGVSLDALGENHDRIRGVPGNFEKVDYLLNELVKLREKHQGVLRVVAEATLSDLTLPFLEKVREYAKKLNIDLGEAWYNQALFYHNVGKNGFKHALVKAVASQSPSPLQEKWLKVLNGKLMKFPCFALNTFCVLKCNGDIVPCLKLWEQKIGNVREFLPTEIWQGKEAKRIRKIVKDCNGCLNSWGVDWSFVSSVYPILAFGLKHPGILWKKLKEHV